MHLITLNHFSHICIVLHLSCALFYICHVHCFTSVKCIVLHLSCALFYICHVHCFTSVMCLVLHLSCALFYICHVHCFTSVMCLVLHLSCALFYICHVPCLFLRGPGCFEQWQLKSIWQRLPQTVPTCWRRMAVGWLSHPPTPASTLRVRSSGTLHWLLLAW